MAHSRLVVFDAYSHHWRSRARRSSYLQPASPVLSRRR